MDQQTRILSGLSHIIESDNRQISTRQAHVVALPVRSRHRNFKHHRPQEADHSVSVDENNSLSEDDRVENDDTLVVLRNSVAVADIPARLEELFDAVEVLQRYDQGNKAGANFWTLYAKRVDEEAQTVMDDFWGQVATRLHLKAKKKNQAKIYPYQIALALGEDCTATLQHLFHKATSLIYANYISLKKVAVEAGYMDSEKEDPDWREMVNAEAHAGNGAIFFDADLIEDLYRLFKEVEHMVDQQCEKREQELCDAVIRHGGDSFKTVGDALGAGKICTHVRETCTLD